METVKSCKKLDKTWQKWGKQWHDFWSGCIFPDLYDKCFFQDMQNGFQLILNLVPKPRTYFHVRLIDGVAKIFLPPMHGEKILGNAEDWTQGC